MARGPKPGRRIVATITARVRLTIRPCVPASQVYAMSNDGTAVVDPDGWRIVAAAGAPGMNAGDPLAYINQTRWQFQYIVSMSDLKEVA